MVHAFDTFVNNGGQQLYSDCTILSIGALRVILELLLLWFRFVANFLYLSVITHWYCYFIFHFSLFSNILRQMSCGFRCADQMSFLMPRQ